MRNQEFDALEVPENQDPSAEVSFNPSVVLTVPL